MSCVDPIFFMGTSTDRSVHVPHKMTVGLKIVFHRYRVDLFVRLICPLRHLEYKVGLLGFFSWCVLVILQRGWNYLGYYKAVVIIHGKVHFL